MPSCLGLRIDEADAPLKIIGMVRLIQLQIVLLIACAGCHRPVKPVEPLTQTVSVANASGVDRLWEGAQEELRRHRFKLDRVDRRSGIITTFPVTSESFFEFWRHDVDSSYDRMESTLRTVRRTVTIRIDQDAEDSAAVLTVTVARDLFSTPERQFNSSAASLRVFSSALPGVAGEPRLSRADDYWIADGRDGAMERRLLERIIERSGVFFSP